MVSLFVANTDNDWFDFLSRKLGIVEVNFWQPGAKEFHAIQPGELLAFRLKSPRHKIGGFGILSSGSVLPIQIAWGAFGESNGVSSYERLRSAIARYRPEEIVGPSTNIGCRILVEPVFLTPDQWLDVPSSWSRSIVGGKRYSTEDVEGLDLWNHLQNLSDQAGRESQRGFAESRSRFGTPVLITPRLGQGAFRVAVTEAYRRQCSVTQGKVLPALDAAHIRPYADGGSHIKSNGILFRKDIHCVFDLGYVTVDTDYKFVVSKKVKEVFNNGEEYRRLHGTKLMLPDDRSDWPNHEHLLWHNTQRFLE